MPEPPISTDLKFDWNWKLVGCETPEEKVILDSMLLEAQRFCSDMSAGREPRWLCLVGTTGCGKTFLAKQICDYVKLVGERAYNKTRINLDNPETCWAYAQEGPRFKKWVNIITASRSGDYSQQEITKKDWFKCIDDIGAEGVSEKGEAYAFASNVLGQIADGRTQKWTVLTSNLTRGGMAARYDPRLASRMTRDGSVIVDASGVRDYQLRMEAK